MVSILQSPALTPILLLVISNLFMTTAWYGHLKFPQLSMPWAIAVSWSLALFEYCLAVPANRVGYKIYSAAQLKTIQEVITLVVFVGFSYFFLGEIPNSKTIIGFILIATGAYFIFQSK